MNDEKVGLIKLTGLWKQQDKDGKVYYSGSFTYGTNILLFPNMYKKEGDKQPDLNLFIARKEKKEESRERESSTEKDPCKEEDIPF